MHTDFKLLPHAELNTANNEVSNRMEQQLLQVPQFGQANGPNQNMNANDRRERMFESTRQNTNANPFQNVAVNSIQNDVLIAAFKALQMQEIKNPPTFNGDNVLEWPNFISEFERSTEEYAIKPSKNLRRLNKALEGNAGSSVQTFLTSPDNVD